MSPHKVAGSVSRDSGVDPVVRRRSLSKWLIGLLGAVVLMGFLAPMSQASDDDTSGDGVGPVRNLVAKASFQSVVFTWDAPVGYPDVQQAKVCAGRGAWCFTGSSGITVAWGDIPGVGREELFEVKPLLPDGATGLGTLIRVARPSVPPAPPRDLQARAGADIVELSWTGPDEHVEGYLVAWGTGELAVTTTQARVTGLVPNSTYTFQVFAVGPGGKSEAVETSISTTLGPDLRPTVPSAPTRFDVIRDQPLSEWPYIEGPLVLQWWPPTSDGRSPITKYSISVNGIFLQEVEPRANQYIKYWDKYGGRLTFEVRAHNQMGSSPPAVATYTGKPTAPSEVQNLVAALGDSTKSVRLWWDAPNFDGGRPIEQYLIRDRSQVLAQIPASRTSIVLEDLEPGRTYEFQVIAVNAVGRSDPSSVVFRVPDEPKPEPQAPGPIRDLGVQSITATSVTLDWKAPAATSGVRAPRAYRILVPSKAPVEVTETSVTIEQLEPDHPYVIQVVAVNDAGSSVPVMVATRTQIGPPSAPRALLAVPRGTPDQMALSWLPPDRSGGSPVTSYRVWWGTGEQVVTSPSALVSGLSPGTRYTFRVTAQNIAGMSPAAEVFAVTPFQPQPRPQPPSAPRDVQVTGVNARSVALDWREPAEPGGSAVTYRVEVEGRTPVETSETAYLVGDLEPNREVVVAIRALNQMGASDPVTVRAVTPMTVPDSPEELRVERSSLPREVRLRWDPPASDGGSPIRRYTVAWDDQTISTTQPGAEITVPQAGAAYTFSVRAINDQGESVAARLRYVVPLDPQPRPGVPSEPLEIEEVAATGTTITLRWQPPARDGGSEIQEYRVYAPGRAVIAVERPLVTVTELAPNREYAFSIVARNQFGDSPPATISSRTLPMLPSTPRDLLATRQGPTSYLVQWEPPTDTGGVPILGYRVTWGSDEAIVASPRITVTDLASGVRYRFRVSALNAVGESPSVDVQATTPLDPQRRPRPGPPADVAVTGQTPTSIALSWRGPTEEGGYPITGYRIDVGSQQITSSSTAYLLRGLTPDTAYTITIRAVSAMGESEPVTITARTSAGSPQPPSPGPAPTPQPQPFSPPLPAGLEESDLDLDGNPLTVRQTAPGQWPKQRVDRSGRPLPIEKFSGFVTNAGQTAKLTVTKKSPSVASVKLSRDRKSRAWVMTATLRPGTVSGSVILTVSAPAAQAKGVRYEPLQSSQQFIVRR